MRYGFIIPTLSGGGAEKVVLTLAEQLTRRGHRVDVVIFDDTKEDYNIQQVDYSVTYLARNTFFWGLYKKILKTLKFYKRLLARKLARTVRDLSQSQIFDLIISTPASASEISMLAGLPNHYCRIESTCSQQVKKLAKISIRKSKRRLARYKKIYNGNKLIAVSHGVKRDLIDTIGQLAAEVDVIYNPFDFNRIRNLAKQPVDRPKQPYIIHVGRFSKEKRHDVLLKAFTRIQHDVKLVLLTKPEPRLDAMLIANGLVGRVIVAGFQQNPYAWMAKAELSILSSDYEGLPNVIIESLIVGTPVVSTDCPSGPSEILGEMPQCLVPCGDPIALATAIDQALANKIDVSGIPLERFSADNIVAAYENLARNPK